MIVDPIIPGRLLAQIQLGTAATTIYTPPAQPSNLAVIAYSLWICNTDTVQHKCTLRMGKGVLTAANSLMEQANISPNTTYIVFDQSPFALSVGQHIEGLADVAAKLTISLFGYVQT